MRQTLFRLLLLVGFLVALVPADTSAQPVKVGEELQKANLQKAQVKAEASKIETEERTARMKTPMN